MHACELPSQTSPAAHWLSVLQPVVQRPPTQISPVPQGCAASQPGLVGSGVHTPLLQA